MNVDLKISGRLATDKHNSIDTIMYKSISIWQVIDVCLFTINYHCAVYRPNDISILN